MRYALLVLLALFFAVPAHADSLPAWDLTASGFFGGNGQPAETFQANFTLHYQQQPGFLAPLWTGSMTFSGLLGNFTVNYANAVVDPAMGFLAAFDNFGDEIDFTLLPYPFAPFDPQLPPEMLGTPFLFSCNVASICAAYGTTVGIGLFSGSGVINQTVTRITPEPAGASLLGLGLLSLIAFRRRPVKILC